MMGSLNINVLGVIPARGGSKRLPRKNIKMLAGKPMLAYTIEASKSATLISDLIVSSEDEEIIKIAKEYGANVPFIRPSNLATDTVTNKDVINHALEFMENEKGITYDIVLLLQPTSPIRSSAHIDEAIRLLVRSKHDTLASVKGPFKKNFPNLKAMRIANTLECYSKESALNEPYFIYNASIYGVKRDYFKKYKQIFSQYQEALIMDEIHSIDVDTELDFIAAEAIIKYLNKGS